jgi:hypothetical protein
MTRRYLTPEEALEGLLDSDASPIVTDNPRQLAEFLVAWLRDCGFRIVANDAEGEE